jgi:hypothetical protein
VIQNPLSLPEILSFFDERAAEIVLNFEDIVVG